MRNDLEHNHPTDDTILAKNTDMRLTTRRKLLVGAVSTPVVLAVSGRSALACTSTGGGCNHKGLSLAAWCSIYPGQGKTATHSHTINTGYACGKWPHHWKPKCDNKNDYTFTEDWPVNPCSRYYGVKGWDQKPYYWTKTYKDAKGVSSGDSGFDDGHKFGSGWGSCSGKSVSRKLINGSNFEQHICAGYLNIKKFGGLYPVSETDLKMLASRNYRGRILDEQEVIAFIQQTCA